MGEIWRLEDEAFGFVDARARRLREPRILLHNARPHFRPWVAADAALRHAAVSWFCRGVLAKRIWRDSGRCSVLGGVRPVQPGCPGTERPRLPHGPIRRRYAHAVGTRVKTLRQTAGLLAM